MGTVSVAKNHKVLCLTNLKIVDLSFITQDFSAGDPAALSHKKVTGPFLVTGTINIEYKFLRSLASLGLDCIATLARDTPGLRSLKSPCF